MKMRVLALSMFLVVAGLPGIASAKGCIKGAVVGGAAGHVAGKHGLAGAAVGCAVGHHRATVKARQNAAAEQSATAPAPTTTTVNR